MTDSPTETHLSIAVIGAGIGGLAAALSLHRAGYDVHVYEQARRLSEVGAGIQVSPNASRVLERLGLAEDLAAMGVRPLAWHQRRWDDGRTLLHTPLGDVVVEAFGSPHYQMHRADLLSALGQKLPADRVHPNHRLVGLSSRTAQRSTSTSWSEPTASTRPCARACSGRRRPTSPVASPTAASSQPIVSATSDSR
jgi:2-polyprenyl-6-methoxyphenol hydroxylase-like FAD-dependent oxidoreductase